MTTFRNRARSRWYATSLLKLAAIAAGLLFAVYVAQQLVAMTRHAEHVVQSTTEAAP